MADPGVADVTPTTSPVTSPADAGNGDTGGETSGTETHATETRETTPEPLWTRLGHPSEDDLVQSHTRYKQQVQGSQAEFQRLQREIALRDGRLAELERAPRQPTAPAPQAPAPTYRDYQEAYEAYLEGRPEALRVYEQEKTTRDAAALQDTIQRAITQTIQKATRPSQLVHPVIEKFPALKDISTPLYKFAYERYDEYAADPYLRTIYPPDADAVQTGRSPDGGSAKPMDIRILYEIAKDFATEQAREDGRREEAQRRAATGGQTARSTGRDSATGTEGPLLYDDEIIHNPRVAEAMAAAGRGTDPRTQRKRYWESMPPAEKRRRQALKEAGHWTGKRT